jgi:hypothetical protein
MLPEDTQPVAIQNLDAGSGIEAWGEGIGP